jgi:hypothetical protein
MLWVLVVVESVYMEKELVAQIHLMMELYKVYGETALGHIV